MKVSKERAAENRERILDAAAKLFRVRGYDGIGVCDLMQSAGLTHGAFYGYFSSKEDLMAQATARALAASLDTWTQRAEQATENPLAAVTSAYLSSKNVASPGEGCLFTALGSDVARQSPCLRRTVTEGFQALIGLLTRLTPGPSEAVKRQKALALYSSLVGAVILARAVDDPVLSEEILQAVAASVPE